MERGLRFIPRFAEGNWEVRMRKPNRDRDTLIALFLLASVLFNYPILSLFNTRASVFGIPLLYVFVFVAWGAVIALAAWIMNGRD